MASGWTFEKTEFGTNDGVALRAPPSVTASSEVDRFEVKKESDWTFLVEVKIFRRAVVA